MNRWLRTIGAWFEARLCLRESLWPMLTHPIPKTAAGPMGWWYVFGSASLTLLLIQIITGIGLALVYVPAADQAYESLLYLNYEQPLGWFLRALHYYAGSGMVVLLLVHMTQVFLHGAYKYPRELTWVIGVVLMILTLVMAFTGYLLPWDQLSIWAVTVGSNMARATPLLGHGGPFHEMLGVNPIYDARAFLFGGAEIGPHTLLRFYILHCIFFPLLASIFMAVHFWRIRRDGMSGPL